MRPGRLTFTAIGSYAGEVEIDFDQLAPYGLFHIHGPTGAGKSSLLDAMCFALYGEVAKPRTADKLRSDHAKGSVEAVAALEFSSQGSDYKIIRKPAQMRPRKRGEGETVQYRSATLLRRDGDSWIPISDNVDEVNAKMRDLVGLNADQFMQVVVLPQGLFAEALRANATRREELLRTLFQTVRFGDYTDILKTKSETARTNYDNAQRGLQRDLDQLTALSHGLGLVADGSFDADAVVVAAHHMLAVQRETLSRLQNEQKELNSKHETALKAAEHWQRKHGASRQLQILEEKRGLVAELELEIAEADAANPLLGKLELFDAAQSANIKAQSLLDQLSAESSKAEFASLSDSELGALGDQYRKRDAELAVKREAVHKQAALQARSIDLGRKVEQEAEAVTNSLAKVQSIDTELNRLDEAIEELRSNGSSIESLDEQLRSTESAFAAYKEFKKQESKLLDARSALLDTEQTLLEAQKHHLSLLEQRMLSMAGELASQLREGSPCAVCGSTEHPHLADVSNLVSNEAIEAAEAQIAALAQQVQPTRVRAEALQISVTQLIAKAGSLIDSDNPRAAVDSLAEQLSAARRDDGLLSQALARQKALRSQQLELDQKRQTGKQTVAALSASQSEVQVELAALAAQYGEVESDEVEVEQELLSEAIRWLTRLVNAREKASSAADALATAESQLNALLASSAFESIDAVRQKVRSGDQLQILRNEVQQWQQAFAAATQTLADPAVAAITEAPDLETTRASLDEINSKTNAQLASVLRLEPTVLQITELSANVSTEMQSLAPLREEQERLTVLWQLCNGTQSNAMRMSLERYVLAAYLEEVATAASLRLQAMSSGRYRLRHSDAKIKGNGASGLTLLISDAYTGNEREVNTLSGGETFLASLSLALGLADVVQSHAGGVAIDALFIDEGFGSLDPETLELAMAELDRLRAGGRLVGIISHVETLRERIPVGIEVIKGPEGSKVRLTGVADLSNAS